MLYVPSMVKQMENPNQVDNLQAALSAKIACTLLLRELMQAQPEIWEGIMEDMVMKGLLNKGKFDQTKLPKTIIGKLVGLNKVSGIKGKDKGNTTLPVTYGGIQSIAILDSGAGISRATKTIWEKWGRPTIRTTP